MPAFKRRRFLLTTAATFAAGAAGLVSTLSPRTTDDAVFGPKRFLRFGQYRRDSRFQLSKFYSANSLPEKRVFQLDLNTFDWTSIEVTSAPHVVETHPIEPRYSLSATQKADTISIVNWHIGKQIYSHVLSKGHFFYGHGIFSEDGDSIFASTYHRSKPSSIMRFSFPDLRLIESFDLPYGLSHEILSLDSNHLLFGMSGMNAANGPGFGILDLRSSKYYRMPIAGLNRASVSAITHLERLSSGFVGTFNVIAGDIDRPSGLASLSGNVVQFHLTPEVSGLNYEILSLGFDANALQIWATVPLAKKILICDTPPQNIVEEITQEQLRTQIGPGISPQSALVPLGLSHDRFRGLTYVVTNENVIVLETKSRTVQKVISKPHAGYSAHARLA